MSCNCEASLYEPISSNFFWSILPTRNLLHWARDTLRAHGHLVKTQPVFDSRPPPPPSCSRAVRYFASRGMNVSGIKYRNSKHALTSIYLAPPFPLLALENTSPRFPLWRGQSQLNSISAYCTRRPGSVDRLQ